MWNLSITLHDCWDQVGAARLFETEASCFCDRGGIFVFSLLFSPFLFSFFLFLKKTTMCILEPEPQGKIRTYKKNSRHQKKAEIDIFNSDFTLDLT